MRLSLSVKETNRLRAKVGLRLIPEGPETLVNGSDEPSQRVQHLQARLLAAEERAEERKLHAAAVEEPVIADAAPESTSSWLERMRQVHRSHQAGEPERDSTEQNRSSALFNESRHTGQEHPDRSPVPQATPSARPASATQQAPGSQLASAAQQAPGSQQASAAQQTPGAQQASGLEASEKVSYLQESSETSQQPTSKIQRPEPVVADPLETPAERQRVLKRRPELDFEQKKAVFKPKKVKTSSKTRSRARDLPVDAHQRENEDDALQAVLTKSRTEELKRMRTAASTIEKPSYPTSAPEGTPRSSNLAIGSTQSFLLELKQQSHLGSLSKETEIAPTPSELAEQEPKPTEDAEKERLETLNEQPADRPSITNSVADTLALLKNEQALKPASQQAVKSRREWTQRLASTRLAEKIEIAASTSALKHLPAHERQQALELHRKEVLSKDAKAAKDLFKDYMPDVKVEHRDEHGNIIDAKQAFKKLSSAFHGSKSYHKSGH